jgi:predicted GNAT family acetyltransferase
MANEPGFWFSFLAEESSFGESAEGVAPSPAISLPPVKHETSASWGPNVERFAEFASKKTGDKYRIRAELSDKPAILVIVHDIDENEVGRTEFDRTGRDRLGKPTGKNYSTRTTTVKEEHQGRGIAEAMYDFAIEQIRKLPSGHPFVGEIVPSDHQTAGGDAIWRRNAEKVCERFKTAEAADCLFSTHQVKEPYSKTNAKIASAWDSVIRIPMQMWIILAGIASLALLAAYVPWTYTIHLTERQSEKPAGYAFLFAPPQPEHNNPGCGVKVDLPRVIIPMGAVVCATIAGAYLTREKKQESDAELRRIVEQRDK